MGASSSSMSTPLPGLELFEPIDKKPDDMEEEDELVEAVSEKLPEVRDPDADEPEDFREEARDLTREYRSSLKTSILPSSKSFQNVSLPSLPGIRGPLACAKLA